MNVTIDVSRLLLVTPRLTLRPWRESDLDDFFAYASVPGVGEMAGWPHHQSPETSRAVMNSFIANKNVFALVLQESEAVIGSLGVHDSWASQDERFAALRIVELGYALSKEYWGRGLMPEAVNAVLDALFAHDLVDAVTVGHFTHNSQSRRVIEKCGFTYLQNRSYFAPLLGETFDECQYIRFKPESFPV